MKKVIFGFVLFIASLHLYAVEIHWQELPKTESFFTLLPNDVMLHDLKQILADYHAIRRDNLEQLPQRIVMLDSIITECDKLSKLEHESIYTHMSLSALQSMAARKKMYLKELRKLYSFFKDDFNSVQFMFSKNHFKRSGVSLELKNNLYFSPHLEDDLGIFWIEMLDPCHRMLANYWNKWKDSGSNVLFFLWLEDQLVDKNVQRINVISHPELEKYKVKVNSGKIGTYNQHNTFQILSTNNNNKEYLFIIDLDNNLLLLEAKAGNRHVSLSAGKPVMSAGNLLVNDGQISKIFFKSGHYFPTIESYKYTYEYLKTLGVDMDGLSSIDYYLGTNIISKSPKEFREFVYSAT